MSDNNFPKLDRSILTVVPLEESDHDLEYWLSKTHAERFKALELNRRMVYGQDQATSRLQRFLEVVELKQD